jgi:deoxyribonuclease V
MNLVEFLRSLDLYGLVYRLVKYIPTGYVSFYSELAKALGDSRYATRSIGEILSRNPNPIVIPCHRVIRKDLTLGGYILGREYKKLLLKSERIKIIKDKVVLEDNLFRDFPREGTLRTLRGIQRKVCRSIASSGSVKSKTKGITFDVAYIRGFGFDYAIVGYVVFDLNKPKILKKGYCVERVYFPYIPTYLAFREYLPMKKCLEGLDVEDSIIFIDGNGLLHPIKCGIATFIGAIEGITTIGIAKSLLTGRVEGDLVKIDKDTVGKVLSVRNKRYYISVGNLISLDEAYRITKTVLRLYGKVPHDLVHNYVNSVKKSLFGYNSKNISSSGGFKTNSL